MHFLTSKRLPSLALVLRLAGGCTNEASALHSVDGGGDATPAACTAGPVAWRVSVTGAITYDTQTMPTATAFGGIVQRVDEHAATFTVTSGDRDVDVAITPAPSGGIGALQVGADVGVRLDHGIIVTEYGNLILSLSEAVGSATESPSLEVATVFGSFHLDTAEALCTRLSPGIDCVVGLTQMSATAMFYDTSTTLAPGDTLTPPTGSWPYDMRLLASDRPATEAELASSNPMGPPTCGATSAPHLVLAATAIASGGASPRCTTGFVLSTPVLAGPPGWRVQATGAMPYDTRTETSGWDSNAVVLSGTILSVDTASASFVLQTTGGSIEITVAPVQSAWLDALSIGRSVVATLHDGVVVRDATTDEVLLAVVAGHGNPAWLDVGPIHLSRGANECVQVRAAYSPCEPGGVVIRTQFEAAISLGATMASARVGDAPTRVTDGSDTYEVALVASASQSGAPANPLPSCDVAIQEALFVAIGRAVP